MAPAFKLLTFAFIKDSAKVLEAMVAPAVVDAVAAVGSKYRMTAFGDEKSFCSAAIFVFLDDRPDELMEALRCRDIV